MKTFRFSSNSFDINQNQIVPVHREFSYRSCILFREKIKKKKIYLQCFKERESYSSRNNFQIRWVKREKKREGSFNDGYK